MNITQIRNATMIIEYGGQRLLVDPFLAPKGTYPAFPNTPHAELRNPLVELPTPIDEIIQVDAVIVTHLHLDHFDDTVKSVLPKEIRIIAQNEQDAQSIRDAGFHHVEAMNDHTSVGKVRLQRTDGRHGTGVISMQMGKVSGFVLSHPTEKTLYVAGDTIWCCKVEAAIQQYKPEVIVVNGGAAQFLIGDPILMTKEDIYRTHQASPESIIISSHMEAVNHCLLSRQELRSYAQEKGIAEQILVPEDGQVITL
ncbi:MBL fold metallo-hydrolase [Paenibacillus alvei]|uniref:MBL fold metallo-hydrolase n=1 Tax=Paenibacillus alvei TaxID=44250 RepID=UPI00227F562A|nr:MBL fold metallo-hydrolase [Paenibacillus alvei]